LKKMTEENIRAAFAGESQAHMRYLIFAKEADKAGRANMARLFRAVAFAEEIHATNHFKSLGSVENAVENLDGAIGGENYEITEMYPAFEAVSKLQGEERASRNIDWALTAEKVHHELFTKAKEAEGNDTDSSEAKIYVCPVCGHTVEGEHPDNCPLCHAPGDMYKEF
jgi:rubrerythrin